MNMTYGIVMTSNSLGYNKRMNANSPFGIFMKFANRLKFRNLFLLTVALFILDMFIPDMIPMIDEIILALIAVILANWKKERTLDKKGAVIEGEVIDENENR